MSKADKLTARCDRDWKNTKSTIRVNLRDYSPAYSWEGQSVSPEPFSKLQETGLPVQPSNPCTLCGKAVVPLERFFPGMPLATVDTSKKVTIPLTVNQRDINMIEDNLSGSVPDLAEAASQGKVLVMKADSGFKNMLNRGPEFQETKIPSFYEKAGPNGDQMLLNPAQRREMMKYDTEALKGYKYVKEAVAGRVKTKKIMNGPQYHRGVVGVDSCDNVDSEIYGDYAKKFYAEENSVTRAREARKEHLGAMQSSVKYNGNYLDPDSMPDTVKTNNIFQSKAAKLQNTFETTKNNIMTGGLPKKDNFDPVRAQRLRDQDICGKNFNIVTGSEITQWPSRAPPRNDNRMLHPSQTALESVRNTQGSLGRY